jgi:hypothetical protein
VERDAPSSRHQMTEFYLGLVLGSLLWPQEASCSIETYAPCLSPPTRGTLKFLTEKSRLASAKPSAFGFERAMDTLGAIVEPLGACSSINR